MRLPEGAQIGIELETNFLLVVGKKEKDVVFEDAQIRVDADTAVGKDGALEFVIKKTDSGAALVAAAKRCQTIAAAIIDACGKARDSTCVATALFAADGVAVIVPAAAGLKVRWDKSEHMQTAAAQFTMGVPFLRLEHYLAEAVKNSSYFTDRVGALGKIHAKAVVNVPALAVGREIWKGFVALFGLYLYDLQSWVPNDDTTEGPKNAVSVMTRSSFREMYLGLVGDVPAKRVGTKEDLVRVARAVLNEVLPAAAAARDPAAIKLIPRAYPWICDGPGKKASTFTITEWITSIVDGMEQDHIDEVVGDGAGDNGQPDWLCPPEGFDALEPRYSLGAMKMDGALVILEHRNPNLEGDNGIVAIDGWDSFANAAFSFAKAVLNNAKFEGADEDDVAEEEDAEADAEAAE